MRRPAVPVAIAAAMLAVAHGIHSWLQVQDTAYLAVLSGFAGILGIIAAGRLWWSNCEESRLVTAAVALCTLLGHLLVAVVGLPGAGEPTSPNGIEVLLVLLSCGTLLLLVLSSSRSRIQPRPGQNPSGHRRHE